MRICQISHASFSSVNGHAMVVDQLGRQYVRLKHETLLLRRNSSEPVLKIFSDAPYPVIEFATSRFDWLERRKLRCALQQAHEKTPFDVVHCHSVYPMGFAVKDWCDEAGIPLVLTTQGGDISRQSRYRRRPGIMAKIRETLLNADAVVAISPFTKDQQLEIAPECADHLVEISNGVDFSGCVNPVTLSQNRFGEWKQKPFILFLGRLHGRKGVSFLIKGFQQIANDTPDAQLVIAGDGDQAAALKSQAEGTGFGGRIHFVGAVFDAEKLWLLQNAFCVVIPTITWEGLPLVALEAMSCGQWVIGTEVGGIVGLIEPGVDGFLVPPSDATALANALRVPFENPASRAAIGSAAKEKARSHDWPVIAGKYLELFSRLIASKRISK